MATLQTSFAYGGDPTTSPVKTVTLHAKFPIYEFVSFLEHGEPFIQRNSVGAQTIQLDQSLNSTSYVLRLTNEFLVGQSQSSIVNYFKYFIHRSVTAGGDDLLDLLSTMIEVDVKSEADHWIHHIPFQGLYSLSTQTASYKELTERDRAINGADIFNETDYRKFVAEASDFVRKNLFLINKNRFAEAAIQFRAAEPRFNDFAFLLIVSHVTDLSSGQPKIDISPDEFRVYLKAEFGIGTAATIKVLLKILNDELFDFPVAVPEIKATLIEGTFKIITPGNTPVSLNDFQFYDLSIEYSLLVPGRMPAPALSQFDWPVITQAPDNTVPFSFGTIITNFIDSLVTVRVKSFDGAVVWENNYTATDDELQDLVIEVELVKPVVLTGGGGGNKPTSVTKKLSGKVVPFDSDCDPKEITVVVQSKKEADTIWKIVGAATTDSSGNFSMPYPYGIYASAQALVSVSPNNPADIHIHTDPVHVSANETIADDFLYLLVQGIDCKKAGEEQDDCHCHDLATSSRLPSQEDLIKSDSYTQDIGGSCINLSVPNRTLNEYRHRAVVRTSDPDVADYTLTKNADGYFLLEGGLTKIQRKPVDLSNPIRWQDAPDDHNNLSIYQAVTVATGHILHYSVVTKADGYSLGELLYSLPLAPGQKKQIVVFEQTHSLMGSETQRLSQREALAASLTNEVSITDTIAGNVAESTRGGSSATTSGVSAGLGLAGIVQGIAGAFGVSGGVANANSTAWQNSSRSLSEYFNEQIKNTINQNAQSYRELNASVVTSVQEGQQYGVTAEVVANHNHCHSLTMMYFEVLRHFAIYQELTHVEECLFVPLLMTDFTRENIFKWKDVLASNLLPVPAETYLQPFSFLRTARQHPLLKGFDAIERIKTDYKHVDFPAGAYDDEIINFVTGEIYLNTNLPRPKSKYDRVRTWPLEKKSTWSWPGALIGGILGGPLGFIAGGYLNSDGSVKAEAHPIIDQYISVDANFGYVPPAQCIRVKKFDDNFFEEGGFDKAQWTAYAKLLGKNVMDMLSYYFKDRLISEWDSIYYNDIAPLVFERILQNISIGSFSAIDFSSETKYKGNTTLQKINLRGNGSNKKRKEISQLNIVFNNSASLTNDLVTLTLRNVTIRYATAHYNGVLFSGFAGDDLIDGSTLFTPENANEKRNPKKEDEYVAQKLITHLNSNLEHYNKALWRFLDIDRRYMLLDGFCIETYNDSGMPVGQRSLASVVKNELVGIAGNALIMPVAPGYKIDRTVIIEQPIEGEPVAINLLEHYKPLTPIPPYRISIPSKGVFAEAVQGACDACEKVRDNTSQDWDKFKTDEPTSINPVTVPVPTVTDWKAAFKDFATPIVNIQNAPATPAPGIGLAAATDLLGKTGIFKDITGLDQNQKNAMQTYLSNQENAKAFAEMAKDIFTMGHNAEHSDKIADAIRNSPELSKEEKAQLLKDHFGQVVDGGKTKKAEQEQAKNTKPSLTDAAVKAVDQGKSVKAENTDAETGRSERIEVEGGTSENVLAEVKGLVPMLQQENENACWATAATMMMSWKKAQSMSVPDVLAIAGQEYVDRFNNKQGLPSIKKEDFISAYGLVGEPPANYMLQTYISFINTYGPLWVTTDSSSNEGSFSPHARILKKIVGAGTPDGKNTFFIFNDPASGTEVRESFEVFLSSFEQMVTDNPGKNLFVQIVHFSEAGEHGVHGEGSDIGEGAATTDAVVRSLNTYVPNASDTIVINKTEFKKVASVTNYKGPNAKHNTSIAGKARRTSVQIKHLVLHETASDTGDGYSPPYTSHMSVRTDATILQFNDLLELEYHANNFNDSSIGIEFVNRGWLASPKTTYKDTVDGTRKSCPARGSTAACNGCGDCDSRHPLYSYAHEAIPSSESALTSEQKTKFAEDKGYLWCFWGGGFNIYRLPQHTDQLEAEVELVRWLTIELRNAVKAWNEGGGWLSGRPELTDLASWLSLPAVPTVNQPVLDVFQIENNWLQLVSYNDVKDVWTFKAADVPPDAEKATRQYFIFTTAFDYLTPTNVANRSGILAHNSFYANHSDGSFLTLYTWLRLEKNKAANKSFELAKDLMKNHFIKVSLTSNPDDKKIVLLDVRDGNLI